MSNSKKVFIKTIVEIAESPDKAFIKAHEKIPFSAEIISQKIISAASLSSIEIEDFFLMDAEQSVRNRIPSDVTINGWRVKSHGRKGFLGLWKKPNLYTFDLLKKCTVEIKYQIDEVTDLAFKLRRKGQYDYNSRIKAGYQLLKIADEIMEPQIIKDLYYEYMWIEDDKDPKTRENMRILACILAKIKNPSTTESLVERAVFGHAHEYQINIIAQKALVEMGNDYAFRLTVAWLEGSNNTIQKHDIVKETIQAAQSLLWMYLKNNPKNINSDNLKLVSNMKDSMKVIVESSFNSGTDGYDNYESSQFVNNLEFRQFAQKILTSRGQ